jgi:hypothetical protein
MFRSPSRRTGIAVALTLALGLSWLGCTDESSELSGPPPADQEAGQFDRTTAPGQEVSAAIRAQEAHTDRLMRIPGVEGTAVGLGVDGKPEIQVYVERGDVAGVPKTLDGIPVKVHVTGKFRALPPQESRGNGNGSADPRKKCSTPPCNGGGGDPPGGGGGDNTDPTSRFVRPVPIGVSTGHPDITAGTIGACVTGGGKRYALSNNHVYADENQATRGDDVLQPGPYDGGGSGDKLGTLSDYVPIEFSTSANNVVDAAIASVTAAELGNATPSNGYGVPKSTPATATIGMRVMKYGRTTGLTKGRVQGINATINVGYDTGVARFEGQIVIGGGGFSAGGDSGSLIVVERGGDARRPVGLLFAGGGGTTIANPIDEVLEAFGVSINCQ